ncbi:MAG: hypothetical protein KA105_03040 [Caulobacter sp.]|nr:hypothetical protein [Caulobacter sp.]
MFVAVYRMRLRPGSEEQYAHDWADITQIAIDRFGSGGSALFKGDDGVWTAIARWPDREARRRFFEREDIDPEQHARQQAAIEERLPILELDCEIDMWTAFPSR